MPGAAGFGGTGLSFDEGEPRPSRESEAADYESMKNWVF
jgi:hypothetical protein